MDEKQNNINLDGWVSRVHSLAEQVRILALNLAINLAREKNNIKELTCLESDFTRLVYSSVEVIREVTAILKAFRNEGKMVYSPPQSSGKTDHIESSLNEILTLSRNILMEINSIKEARSKVDKYKGPVAGQNLNI